MAKGPVLFFSFAALLPLSAMADDGAWRESGQTALHLLDYVGVDYPEFVRDGEVVDEAEYVEQLEFATRAVALLQALPERPERARLVAAAESVLAQVKAKAPGPQVAGATADLRWALIGAYSLAVAPKQVPDLARGQQLYASQCASCHGDAGKGDGAAGRGLEPAPADFTDATRSAQRSIYGLYNTITLGVGGTGMAAYRQLPDADRWALAFFASQLALTPDQLASGEAAWQSGRHAETFADLENLATLSNVEIAARFGADAALAQQWLRAHPEALEAISAAPIQRTITNLRESLAAHRRGDSAAAQQLALTAYLEGFELVEAQLDAVDADLRTRIERELMRYRTQVSSGASVEVVEQQLDATLDLLAQADAALGRDGLAPGAVFTSSLLILLREGLEAILVLAAIIAFLVKSGRRDALPWVHAGWALALVAGAATWLIARYVVAISGASREMTEAVSALFAAGVLLYVGVWLHSKANARAWQDFVREQVGGALGRKTLWALASVSFLAVYRELFEIVLFYQALWAQAGVAGGGALLSGMGAAVVILAVVGWAIFHWGLRLPIAHFFTATSVVLAVLAVIFLGQGVSALQEAGAIGVRLVDFVRVPALGIFPTAQTLLAQCVGVLVAVASFTWASRRRIAPMEQADDR